MGSEGSGSGAGAKLPDAEANASADGSVSNSSGAPANGGPFGSRMVRMTTSMDTTNSNSGHHSANQSDQMRGFRGLTSSASQKERVRFSEGRESPFETMKHQQQSVLANFHVCGRVHCRSRVHMYEAYFIDLQHDQQPHLGNAQRLQHPHSQRGPQGGQGPSRLQPQGGDRLQPQTHNPFAGLQPQGGDRQPQGSDRQLQGSNRQQQQQPGLSNFQQHQIQQAYNSLMQQKQHLPTDEANPHHMSDSSCSVQPGPCRAGPSNMLSLPSYRILPSLTMNDLDTIMKLRQQLSGKNGLLTRLSGFMQVQRSTYQRTMTGHDSSQSVRAPASAAITGLDAEGSGHGRSPLASEAVKEQAQLATTVQRDVAKDSLRKQPWWAAIGHDGKPMLGRFSIKAGSLLDQHADVMGAFEGTPVAQEGQHLIPLLHPEAVASCCCIFCAAQTFR
ncbi:TPA: hypothetical protein ACH3X2_000297 [Trebouxia sp. C0005]